MERAAAPRVEELVKSDQFSDAMIVITRLRAEVARQSERAMRRALHFWNLPAASDIKRVSEQVASLERRMRELSKRLEDLGESSHVERPQHQRPRRSHPA